MAFAIPQTLGKAPSSLGSFKTLWMINCRFPYRLSCRKHIYWTPVCNLITSVKNEKVKLVRALANTSYRRTSKKIVCEGLRLVSDALKRGLKPDFILYSDDVFQSASFRHYFSEQLFATPVAWKTTHDIMASLSDSVTCQGIIAVFEQPCDNMPSQPDLVLVCDRLQDPGNLGSLLRSAAATGVDGVIISPDSTDPYSVKVLRGGMGAHFAIPIKICEDWKWFLQVVQDLGISLYLADSNAEQSHYQLDLREPLAVIVSSEAHGPSTFVKQLDAHRFKIPMHNAMESLNVAVAGSVFLYEVLRQREEKSEMKIGIVGFGNFGQFLAKTFVKQGHKVIGTSRSNYEVEAKSLGALYVPTTSDLMEQDPDVVVFCTSITSTRSVVESFPVDTLRGKLVVDVLSVKVYPKKLLLELLPQDADILCTHPMFGPESGRYSWKGLPFVYEQVRISDQVRCETFLGIFSSALCTMIPMSSELHDSYAASSQFITHTTGRMLAKLNLQSTPINTKGYESLLGVVETTCKDSFDLYYGLYKYNPNAKLELEKMEQALQALRKELETREALDAPNKD